METVTSLAARDSRSVIRFYPEWPTYTRQEAEVVWAQWLSHRFGLLTDPLGMTGLCGSQCEPYWLVTVSGSQGSDCGGFHAYPAVLPAADRQTRIRRQGDTLRTHQKRVNGFPELFPGPSGVVPKPGSGSENASQLRGRRRRHGNALHLSEVLCRRLSRLPRFSTHTAVFVLSSIVRCCTLPAVISRSKRLRAPNVSHCT